MNYQGKIVNWNDDKGYGFVQPNGGGERAFVHIKAFTARDCRPTDGELIVYELVKEKNNRFRAFNITFARANVNANRTNKKSQQSAFATYFTTVFSLTLLAVILLGKLAPFIGGIYLCMSVVAFIAYARDKSAAQAGRWRIQESTLHLFALIGGWPGAFIAQKILRHKSSKREFKITYWFTVILNLTALVYLQSDIGIHFVNKVLMPLIAAI
ncbi:cold shock and DUF1294 domain-containing protein [Psychromonas sp. MME2]|uniref:cold shock and DUF1294 domain-containing protein n=1 Tax=Psychromonas sp. MME2 TaxID=3231033 RepID=UPI00339BEC04